jgi:hypothetical protein
VCAYGYHWSLIAKQKGKTMADRHVNECAYWDGKSCTHGCAIEWREIIPAVITRRPVDETLEFAAALWEETQ